MPSGRAPATSQSRAPDRLTTYPGAAGLTTGRRSGGAGRVPTGAGGVTAGDGGVAVVLAVETGVDVADGDGDPAGAEAGADAAERSGPGAGVPGTTRTGPEWPSATTTSDIPATARPPAAVATTNPAAAHAAPRR